MTDQNQPQPIKIHGVEASPRIGGDGVTRMVVHDMTCPNMKGMWVMQMITSMMGSADRALGERLEMISDICDVVEATYAEFDRRGWLAHYPSYKEAEEAALDHKIAIEAMELEARRARMRKQAQATAPNRPDMESGDL